MMIAAAIAAAMTLMADTETVGGYTWKYQINGNTAEIKSGISPNPTGALTIPSALGGKPVTSIGEWAFNDCGRLTSVTIPDGVTSIGKWAFGGCSALKVVSLPRRFEGRLDESVFSDCAEDLKIEYR